MISKILFHVRKQVAGEGFIGRDKIGPDDFAVIDGDLWWFGQVCFKNNNGVSHTGIVAGVFKNLLQRISRQVQIDFLPKLAHCRINRFLAFLHPAAGQAINGHVRRLDQQDTIIMPYGHQGTAIRRTADEPVDADQAVGKLECDLETAVDEHIF